MEATGSQTGLFDGSKKQQRLRWFKVACTDKWWDCANGMNATCATCTMTDGKTACEKQFAVNFGGRLIPFGAKVSYKPISS